MDRRRAALAAPVAVPLSMTAIFLLLGRLLPVRKAHLAGFCVYWIGWCYGFPLWVLGPRRALKVLRSGRSTNRVDLLLTAFPVLGAVSSELVPNRKLVDGSIAAVAVCAAGINAVGEELLWRGVYLDQFPESTVLGALWPLFGFTVWHLAPQTIRPSSRGRFAFLVGAAVVGAVSTVVARRNRGLHSVLVSHLLTDACGVRTAGFWLGRA